MGFSKVPGLGRVVARFHRAVDARVDGRFAEVDRRLGELNEHINWVHEMINRLGPQVAALETRLADREFDQRLIEAATGKDGDALAAAEAEHRRVRERLALISQYEERIRRLEERAG